MQINKTSNILRRLADMPADLKVLVDSLATMELDRLPDALDEFSKVWGRPRGDLCLWISVLNRHDDILKDMVTKYELDQDKIKPQPFDPEDEKLISAIFNFTAFILSNSSNRGIFASEKYIFAFLYSISPTLVSGALRVCVTLAIHHIHSKYVRSYLAPSEVNVVLKYATFLSSVRAEGPSGASDPTLLDYLSNSNPLPGFSVQFYLRGTGSAGGQKSLSSPQTTSFEADNAVTPTRPRSAPHTPVPRPRTSIPTSKEGLTEYIISAKDAIDQPLHVSLQRIFNAIPEEYWLDAVLKTFIAKSTANTEEGAELRSLLVEMQCDALTITGYSFNTSTVDSKIFSEYPHMIRHLCQLILPESNVTQKVRVSAIDTFCSLACQVSLVPDIVIALSSHVNHGPLMIVVRHVIKDLKRKHEVNQDFLDGITSLILQLSNLASTGSMVTTTSELIPLLIELVKIGTAVPRARSNALDALMHILSDSATNMATFLRDLKGSEVALQFYEEAVESFLIPANQGTPPKYCSVDYCISYYNAQWLKNIIHLIAAIATHGRASDRIHIILESKFIPLTTKIVLHPEIFGSRTIILALGILGNMIENESSSLHVMFEKDHMESILNSVPNLLAYSTAFHTPIAKFYNSLFHHEMGLTLNKERGLIKQYFQSITAHINGKDSLKHLGATFDQICTEHTSLRPSIISESIGLIDVLRSNLDKPSPSMHSFSEMEYVDQGGATEEDIQVAKTHALLASSIAFTEGLLKNAHSQIEFIKQKGVSSLLCFFELESLTYDFTYNSPAMALCLTLKQLFDLDIDRRYVGEAIIGHFEKAVSRVEHAEALIDGDSETDIIESPEYKKYLESLGPLNNIMYAFYVTVFTNFGTGFRIVHVLEQLTKADISCNLITRLGKIQRQAIWEDSRITQHISTAVRDATRAVSLDDIFGSPFKRLQDTEDVKKLKELEANLKEEGKTSRFAVVKAGRFLLNGVIFTVSKLYYDISSCISRDPHEHRINFGDKQTYKLLESIAGVFVGHFNRIDINNTSEVPMRFLVDALTCLQKVMYRPFNHTLILSRGVFIFFKQLGGIMKMVEILENLFYRPDANNDDSITAGAIKVLLILTNYMVSGKSVIEDIVIPVRTWGQHKSEEQPNYFLLPQFFLECRLTVFNSLIKLWKSDALKSKPSSISSLVVSIMSAIFMTDGEFFIPNDFSPKESSYISWQEACPSESVINAFENAGFDRTVVEEELTKAKNDPKITYEKLATEDFDEPDLPKIIPPSIPVSVPSGPNGLLLTLADLKSLRESALEDALDYAINVLREHPENVFVISTFISRFIPSEANARSVPLNKTAISEIMMAICSMDPELDDDKKPLAAYCHLLGLLLYDRTTLYHALEEMIEFLPTFVNLLERPDAIKMEWFSHVLLILESVLTEKDVPDELPGVEFALRRRKCNDFETPKTKPLPTELSERIFNALLNIDEFTDEMTTLAISRLLVYFTRDFKKAGIVKTSPVLLRLIKTVKEFSLSTTKSGTVFSQLRTTIMIILRHTVETPEIVRNVMKTGIFNYLESHSTSYAADLYTFMGHYSHLLARSPELFVEVVGDLCTLAEPENPRSNSICLKTSYEKRNASHIEKYKEIKGLNQDEKKDEDSDVLMEDAPSLHQENTTSLLSTPAKPQKDFLDSTFSTPTPKIALENSGIVHLLISELLSIKREDMFIVPEKTEIALRQYMQKYPQKKDKADEKKPSSKPGFHYACFLLQGLTELVGSYTNCKLDFISYSKKSQFSTTSVNFRPRSTVLNYFLNELLPCGVLGTNDTLPFNEWSEISSLASITILNLLNTTDENPKPKGQEDEIQNEAHLVIVRKFTIDAILRAFKEVSRSSDILDWRYSKLNSLSELCYKLMSSRSSRPSATFPFDFQGVSPADGAAIAKMIYDKNFAAVLTGSLSDIDLNYPDAKRPIRSLTRSLNKLSRLTMEVSDDMNAGILEDEYYDEHLGDITSDEDGYDEETPDIFRNSTLGMFEAGEAIYDIEDGAEVAEDESDSEMEEEEEMEYEDDDAQSDVDSSAVSETQDGIGYDDEEIISISEDSGDMSSSGDEDTEDEDEDSENEEVGHFIIETDLHHDHEMGDAENYNNASGSDDSDWESFEEGEEDESQIEAVETMLQQRDEGGLGRNTSRHNDRPLLDEEEEDDGDDLSDSIEGGYHSESDNEVEDDDSDAVANFVLRGLESATGRQSTRGMGNEPIDRLVANPLLQEFVPNSAHISNSVREPIASVFQSRQRERQHANVQILGQILQSLQGSSTERADGNFEISNFMRPPIGFHPIRRDLGRLGDSNKDKHGPKHTTSRWNDASVMFKVFIRTETYYKFADYVLEKIVPYATERYKEISEMRKAITEYEESEREKEEDRQATAALRVIEDTYKEIQDRHPKVDDESQDAAENVPTEDENITDENAASSEEAANTTGHEEIDTESVEMVDQASDNEESSNNNPELYMNIGGTEINVGGLGIDPTFLEALPEEMREEVLTQHLRELQESANRGDTHDEELVSTFLNVLPSNVRRELMEHDIIDTSTEGIVTQELDPASFFASLDQSLRETLLLEQDDETLSTLPADLVAEAQNIRSRTYSRPTLSPPIEALERQLGSFGNFTNVPRTRNPPPAAPTKKKVVSAASLHLIDKQGVAALIRTLYLPQPADRRDILHELLLNLCSNKTTRSDVINIILHVLQDASLDKPSLDRGFMQTSNRARYGQTPSKGSTPRTPVHTPGRVPSGYNVLNQEITPNIVTQQVLEALEYLVRFSGNVKYFFLSEHALPIGRKPSRKGKSKDKEGQKEQRYPINILFNLLDRRVVRENMLNLEMLSAVIQEITRALPILLKPPVESDSPNASTDAAVGSSTDFVTEDDSLPVNTATSSSVATAPGTDSTSKDETPTKEKKSVPKLENPPYIPDNRMKLISETLIAKECTSHAFQKLVNVMQNLSTIDGVKTMFGAELVSQALAIGPKILHDLNDLTELIRTTEKGSEIPPSAVSKFSSASSDQAKLLRVLTAVDYLFDPARSVKSNGEEKKEDKSKVNEASKYLKSIYESMTFGPLWGALSDCLKLVQDKPDLVYIATSLLSLIESLMVICKHSSVKDVQLRENSNKYEVKRNDISAASLETLFFSFTDEHRKILNHLIRSNPKLMLGSFSILFKNPKCLEFDNKRRYFNRQIYQNSHSAVIHLNVRRDQVFLDSYKSLYFKSASEIKDARLNIKFQGEEGVDAGGVTREWYQVLSRQIFNPDYALFSPVASDRTTFHPNRTSWVNPEHLSFFKFIGRIIGKAIYDNKLLDCHFSRAVYKRILGKSVSLKDMETLDLDYYKSLVWMLENDITDIITETFSIDADDYGEQKVIDLKPNGRNIPVTEENKAEYVKLVVEYRLVESIKDQLNKFLEGFHDIIPKDVVAIFDEQELELLISGMPDIDLDDWKSNTEYRNYTAASPQIKWFWRAVRSFDAEEKAKLLQFATGTSKVPLNGFKELVGMHGVSKFTIHRDYGSKDRLPSSHTCFNQIDLPEYSSYETLRGSLLMAITEGREGFGFA